MATLAGSSPSDSVTECAFALDFFPFFLSGYICAVFLLGAPDLDRVYTFFVTWFLELST